MSNTLIEIRGVTSQQNDNPFKYKKPIGKFFGYADETWARLRGKYGKKRSYGHFAGSAADYPKHLRKLIKNPPPEINDEV